MNLPRKGLTARACKEDGGSIWWTPANCIDKEFPHYSPFSMRSGRMLTQKILKVKCLQMQFPAFWRLNWVHARKCRVHSSFDLSATQSMIYYLFTVLLNVVASFFGNKRVADVFRCASVLIETSGHLKGVKKSWAVYFSKMCIMSGCLLRDI